MMMSLSWAKMLQQTDGRNLEEGETDVERVEIGERTSGIVIICYGMKRSGR